MIEKNALGNPEIVIDIFRSSAIVGETDFFWFAKF